MSNNKDFKVKNGIQPTVYHEAVGTVVSGSVGYYLAGASYDSVSFSVLSQTGTMQGFRFGDSGSKVYVASASDATIYQYDLSTAYDISTAAYASKSFLASSQSANSYAVDFKSDGTKMYILGLSNDSVYQYSLSTAWDVSTASYDSVSFSIISQEGVPSHVEFKVDGTSFYVVGLGNDTVYQYDMTTAWDLSTASYASKSMSTGLTNPYHFTFKPDGTEVLVVEAADIITQFSLTTAWDISTGSADSITLDVSSEVTGDVAIQFNGDGTKLIAGGDGVDALHQYSTVVTTNTLDLSTGSVFEVTPTSDIQVSLTNPAASGTSSGATLLLGGGRTTTGYDLSNAGYDDVSFSMRSQDNTPRNIAFNNDGTKMYMVGHWDDYVYQYTLSTAFDLSTISYDSVSFYVGTQDNYANSISFNNNGTKMFILGAGAETAHQYTLSTAFDMSTASYDSVSFSLAIHNDINGLFFKNDGTKMYVLGSDTDSVLQYTLSTAWNLSTASYDSVEFSVASQSTNPYAIFFSSNGTKMYMVSPSSDSVYQYTLSTAWDMSTASYDSVSFSVNSQDSIPVAIAFNNDGTKMYVVGNQYDKVYQYSTGSAPIITYDSAIQFSGGTAPTLPFAGETDVITFNTTDGGTTYQAVQAIDGAS